MATHQISIIMPVYNAGAHLLETINSIRAQTFADFEVICVDDGSTDDSVAILKQVMENDDRFILLQQKNAGAGAARNLGFESSNGEYAIFLDSDDLFSPKLLEKLYRAIHDNQADVAACNFSRFDAEGNEKKLDGVYTKWIPNGLKVFSYRDCPDYIMRVVNPVPWNKLYRSAYIREKGLKFEEISSTNDITFAAVSVAAAERVTYIPDSLIRYRTGHAGTISSGKAKNLDNIKTAVFSAVRQAQALPHGELIQKDIAGFVVGNFLYSLTSYIKDFSSEQAKEFYTMVHETFNRAEFADVDPRTLHNPKQYREFCTVRKHDYAAMKRLISRRIIVSLTTYPKRIGLIPRVLKSLYGRPRDPDEVVLWLAEEQFPGKEKDLPAELLQCVAEKRLTIRWCDDLKAHKKYFYALQEYSDDLVVTVDDDLWYTWNTLSSLYASYLLYPEAVSTVRAHLILLDENNRILPYRRWIQETDACIYEPSMQLMATGGAGVLYPPNLFRKEFFDKAAVMENCPLADDLWLKAMQLVSDVPVVLARPYEPLQYLPGSQEEALHFVNVGQSQNDVQLANIQKWLDKTFEPDILVRKLTRQDVGATILGMEAVSQHLDQERKVHRIKARQTESKLKQTEEKQKQTEVMLKQAETGIRQTETKLSQAEGQLRQTENRLQQSEDQLRQAKNQLRQSEDQLRQRQEKLAQTELAMNRTQADLQQMQQKLLQTEKKLRWTEENSPINRQLKNVGSFLQELKAKGHSPFSLGFKYLIYLLAWIPEKILVIMMYYLKHGFTHTVKHALKKLLKRG